MSGLNPDLSHSPFQSLRHTPHPDVAAGTRSEVKDARPIHCAPRGAGSIDPEAPLLHSGCKNATLGPMDSARARTYHHGALGDLLDEAFLLQLANFQVDRCSPASQRQQLPQQHMHGQPGLPRRVPAPLRAGPAPRAPRLARPRHLPRLSGTGGDGDSGWDYKSQDPSRAPHLSLPAAPARTTVPRSPRARLPAAFPLASRVARGS